LSVSLQKKEKIWEKKRRMDSYHDESGKLTSDLEEDLEEEVVSSKTFFALRTAYCVTKTENKYIKELANAEAEKQKERFQKEQALRECEYLKEKAAYEARMKELEFSNLRMQLDLEKTKTLGNGEGGSSSEMEARAKDMELANLRLQLEQEKGKNKRGSEENAGGSAGPRRRSVAADALLSDSSSQVVLMPYSDSMTKKDFASNRQSRRFRWLMVYSAPRALEVL
jgi:hypothetical protein